VSGLEVRPEVETRAVSGQAPGGADTSAVAAIDAASHMRPGWEVAAEGCGESAGIGSGAGGNPDLEPRSPTPNLYRCQAQVRNGDALEPVLDLAVSNLSKGALDLAGAGIDASAPFRVNATGDGTFVLTLRGIAASAVSGDCVGGSASGTSATTVDLVLGAAPCAIEVAP
jgi:hypothetical protein